MDFTKSLLSRSLTLQNPGIGNMGYHMAGHLRKGLPSTVTLHIYDINSAACDQFVQDFGSLGPIKIVSSAKEAATNSKSVISVLPQPNHVSQVYLDPATGIINAPKDPERILLECSTIDIETTKAIGRQIMEAGLGTYIDSPISVQHPPLRPSAFAGLILIFHFREALLERKLEPSPS